MNERAIKHSIEDLGRHKDCATIESSTLREMHMSAVIAAVFTDHDAAVRVRTQFVNDGFPTDRVQLTSRSELGQARVIPEESTSEKLIQHFRQPFPQPDSGATATELAQQVMAGHAVIVVHPRGDVETQRAFQLLGQFEPLKLHTHDLDKQFMEQAAAPTP